MKKARPKSKRGASPRRGASSAAPDGKANAFYRPFSRLPRAAAGDSSSKPKQPAPRDAQPPEVAREVPESAETFATYMAGVAVLDRKAARVPKTASEVDRPAKGAKVDLDATARARLGALILEGLRFEVTDDGDCIEGRRVDVEPREVRRLRRGQYSVDGRLDLHGMTAGEARIAIEAYVKKRSSEGDRVVAIVHGKGSHSPRGVGVLRGEIAAWLSQGPAARHVAAFASPPSELGGSGAVLVLLAR